MSRILVLLSAVALLVMGCARADTADELVDITAVRENLNNALQSCREFAKDLISEEYKLNYQANELGLAPDDPAWLKLADIYQRFYDDACSYVDVDELTALSAEMYREQFTEGELAEIVKFHQTEAGTKYVSVTSTIGIQLNQVINQRMAEGSVEARTAFDTSLQEFWLEQDFKPKTRDEADRL
ncbi:MAG: DUF2059 domain-containing protein [Pseudomonadota bacterium]